MLQKKIKLLAAWVAGHPAGLFLTLSAAFGLLLCFGLPPLGGSDEFTHFPRAYQVSQGQLRSEKVSEQTYGGYLPGNVKNMVDEYRDLSRKENPAELRARTEALQRKYSGVGQPGTDREATPFTASAVYSSWSYAPSAVGMKVASVLRLPLLWYVYLGRIFTLLVFIALAYAAIRVVPLGKWFLFTLALLPTSLTQAVTIGPDALVNGASWLLVAVVMAVFARNVPVGKKSLWAMLGLALLLCTTKQGYWLLAGLPLLLPAAYFKDKKQAWLWRAGAGTVLFLASLLYLQFSAPIARLIPYNQRPGEHVNSTEQLEKIRQEPEAFARLLVSQVSSPKYDEVVVGVAGRLTNRLIELPRPLVITLYLTLLVALGQATGLAALRRYRHFFIALTIAVMLGTFLIITLALYVSFTTVGNNFVEGVQGRYFLPIIPMLLFLRLAKTKKTLTNHKNWLAVGCLTVTLVSLMWTIKAIMLA